MRLCSLRSSGSQFPAISSCTPSSAAPSLGDPVFTAAGAPDPEMPPVPEALTLVPPTPGHHGPSRDPVISVLSSLQYHLPYASASPLLRADPVARHPKPCPQRQPLTSRSSWHSKPPCPMHLARAAGRSHSKTLDRSCQTRLNAVTERRAKLPSRLNSSHVTFASSLCKATPSAFRCLLRPPASHASLRKQEMPPPVTPNPDSHPCLSFFMS